MFIVGKKTNKSKISTPKVETREEIRHRGRGGRFFTRAPFSRVHGIIAHASLHKQFSCFRIAQTVSIKLSFAGQAQSSFLRVAVR